MRRRLQPGKATLVRRPGTFEVPSTTPKSELLHSSWVGGAAQGSRKGKDRLSIMLGSSFSSENKISHRMKKQTNKQNKIQLNVRKLPERKRNLSYA